jgi:hypothetical protein
MKKRKIRLLRIILNAVNGAFTSLASLSIATYVVGVEKIGMKSMLIVMGVFGLIQGLQAFFQELKKEVDNPNESKFLLF